MAVRGLTVIIPIRSELDTQERARSIADRVAHKEGYSGEPAIERIEDPEPAWAFTLEQEL